MARKDLIGQRFGRLTPISVTFARRPNTGQIYSRWLCKCDCGNFTEVQRSNLTSGDTKSCGCLSREISIKVNSIHRHSANGTISKTYRAWAAMRSRCSNPKATGYKNYGGRGIKICDRWNDFENFLKDMGESPEGLTLERENNNGNYKPGNCIWATRYAQNRNRRTVKLTLLKVKAIRRLVKTFKIKQCKVAEIFGVSEGVISLVLLNKTWQIENL